MTRYLAALAAGLLFAAMASAETPRKVTIRWHGQSFFEIVSSKGTRIAIDPHAIDAYGPTKVSADIVLISHEHSDHNQIGVLSDVNRAQVLRGLKTTPGKKPDWNPIDETIRDVHIRSVGVYHDAEGGKLRGKNAIFIIDVDGLHLVHLGDLGHVLSQTTIKEIGPVDVLMIPVGGVYTINGSEAKEVVEQLKPRQYILPMHYGTKVFNDLLPPDEFLEDQKNVRRLPGNKLVVASDFKPAEPVIVLLDWKD